MQPHPENRGHRHPAAHCESSRLAVSRASRASRARPGRDRAETGRKTGESRSGPPRDSRAGLSPSTAPDSSSETAPHRTAPHRTALRFATVRSTLCTVVRSLHHSDEDRGVQPLPVAFCSALNAYVVVHPPPPRVVLERDPSFLSPYTNNSNHSALCCPISCILRSRIHVSTYCASFIYIRLHVIIQVQSCQERSVI
mgnify:CR=1 FL=1